MEDEGGDMSLSPPGEDRYEDTFKTMHAAQMEFDEDVATFSEEEPTGSRSVTRAGLAAPMKPMAGYPGAHRVPAEMNAMLEKPKPPVLKARRKARWPWLVVAIVLALIALLFWLVT